MTILFAGSYFSLKLLRIQQNCHPPVSSWRSNDSAGAMARRQGHSPVVLFYFLPALACRLRKAEVHGGGRHVGVLKTRSGVEDHHFVLGRKPSARYQVIVGRG